MLRYAFGIQSATQHCDNQPRLFLTLFTMMPVIERMNTEAYAPSLTGRSIPEATERALIPLRDFMIRGAGKDMALITSLLASHNPNP